MQLSGKTAIKRTFLDHLFSLQEKFPTLATINDYYLSFACVVRDRLLHRWINTAATYPRNGSHTAAYLSTQFQMGPHLGHDMVNPDIFNTAHAAMKAFGLDLEQLLAQEEEPGLGNGGLGRLADVMRSNTCRCAPERFNQRRHASYAGIFFRRGFANH